MLVVARIGRIVLIRKAIRWENWISAIGGLRYSTLPSSTSFQTKWGVASCPTARRRVPMSYGTKQQSIVLCARSKAAIKAVYYGLRDFPVPESPRWHQAGCRTFVLDGDNIRHGLCSDLGFSDEDRVENIRRIGEVGKLFVEAGVIAMTAFISPFRADREKVRGLVTHGDFIEVYCKASLDVCEKRDPKGLYKKARAAFTGISSPYEEPENPEVLVETGEEPLEASVDKIMNTLRDRGILK